ncbi:TRAP transporter small permease subunit [Ahrensia kielensis]|uniref:TRAP transporter small permease protein n=1 Tax=Ahrensia kielensis TaxID=76980 RepID=A0ABU9TAE6_9HYPH
MMAKNMFDRLEWWLEKSAALMCLALIFSLFTEVLMRYVFFTSFPEIQFIVPFCFVWMVMLASAIAVRRGQHFEVDLLQKVLRGPFLKIHRTLMFMIVIAGGAIIAWSSISFLELGMLKKHPATGIRMIYIYASMFGGGLLVALMALEQLLMNDASGPDDIDAILESNKTDIRVEDFK